MSDAFSDANPAHQGLSALVDGEATPQEVTRACAQWRDDADTRARWHRYQLIGDVMRSEDLAQTTRGDAFLRSFRERLAQEPVVLAPGASAAAAMASPQGAALLTQAPLRKRVWAGPLSVAAGLVLMVGALINGQMLPGTGGTSASFASSAQGVAAAYGGGTAAVDLSSALIPLTPADLQLASSQRGEGGVGNGASFSQPEAADAADAAMVRDPQVEALVRARRATTQTDTFSAQAGLLHQVGFQAP
jgi:sigma-E factor negative regulatory protein RseA